MDFLFVLKNSKHGTSLVQPSLKEKGKNKVDQQASG